MKAGPDMAGLWLWPLAALYLVRMIKGGDLRQWLWVGCAIGFALESKYSVLYFVVAFLAGLLMTRERRILWSKWFLAGAGAAVLIALPNFLWQAINGFPMWELLRNGQLDKNVVLSPLQYIVAEVLITNPVFAVIWLCGLGWLVWNARTRFLGYGYILLIAMMIASHAKHYYPGDVYPILFAAAAVAIESWTQGARFLRPAIAAIAFLAGLVLLPYVEPILPEETFIRYNKAVGPKLGLGLTVTEHLKQNWMTQDWSDMHGWPKLAAVVQGVYDALPPSDRARAVAITQDYGEASAIAFFSHVPVISRHNQYFLWGPRGYTGDVLIDVSGDCGAKDHLFREARRAATFTAPYIMQYEDHIPIMVCRGIKIPLSKLWPGLKVYE